MYYCVESKVSPGIFRRTETSEIYISIKEAEGNVNDYISVSLFDYISVSLFDYISVSLFAIILA